MILLTGRSPESRILPILCRGAHGYFEENMLPTFLAKAVRAVDAGECWIPRMIFAKVVELRARQINQASGRA